MSVGSLSLEDICRGSHQKPTASHGLMLRLAWGLGPVPHLDSLTCAFSVPPRLWAAVVHQAVPGRRGHECR